MNTTKKKKNSKSSALNTNSKFKQNNRTTPISLLTKEGNATTTKGRYTSYNSNTISNDLRVSISHKELNSKSITSSTQGNNNIESVSKIKEEILSLKSQNQELLKENMFLKDKLNNCKTQMQFLEDKYDILKANNSIKANNPDIHHENLINESMKILENFIEMTEILTLQQPQQTKSGIRDSARINNDNISSSIDVYEPSIYNDDDRKICILEQIQSIILFKLKFFHQQFGLDTDILKGRVKNWNINSIKDKSNSSNSVSFSNISQIRSKAQNIKSPYSHSSSNTSSNIVVPLSPKFYDNEESDFCKSLNELNEEEESQQNCYSFTTEEAKINFASTFKSIPSGIHYQQDQNDNEKEDDKDQELINEVQYKMIDSIKDLHYEKYYQEKDQDKDQDKRQDKNKDKEEEEKLNYWNNQIEISFEGNTL